jgi:hypothetical protein
VKREEGVRRRKEEERREKEELHKFLAIIFLELPLPKSWLIFCEFFCHLITKPSVVARHEQIFPHLVLETQFAHHCARGGTRHELGQGKTSQDGLLEFTREVLRVVKRGFDKGMLTTMNLR